MLVHNATNATLLSCHFRKIATVSHFRLVLGYGVKQMYRLTDFNATYLALLQLSYCQVIRIIAILYSRLLSVSASFVCCISIE